MTRKLFTLGTGCMIPTKERNHLANILEFEGDYLLFDCGEGTQTQLRKAKIPLSKVKKIFISHWHGDHTIGLNGLIQTLNNTQNIDKIQIYGPKNSKKFIKNILNSSIFKLKIELEVFEIIPKKNEVKKIFENPYYKIFCAKLNHSVDCIGFSFCEKDKFNLDKTEIKKYGLENDILSLTKLKNNQKIKKNGKEISPKEICYLKKGLKISFIFDTRPCPEIDLLVKESDYLIIEATYVYKSHIEKAEENDHMSAKESAEIAKFNNVRNLIITHFSQRYLDIKEIEEEAKEIFENVTAAYDLMSINLIKQFQK